MDSVEAERFFDALLKGGAIDAWTLIDRVRDGKSAVVLRGESNGQIAAVKVFHPDITDKFGVDSQLIRIDREKKLIGNSHPNLVRILGGGQCPNTAYLYVVMDLLPGKSMAEVLHQIPRANIVDLVEQLARAAKFLEDIGVVHRDIKPDNIQVSPDYTHLTLMDFGVLKPVGDSSATDQPGHHPFIGTHQYSPPEMLHRREEDTVDGWRAITFYQIGAVIHDLIMKKPLFEEHTAAYANLVYAVDNEVPAIDDPNVSKDLIALANRCLQKNPIDRLRVVKWEDFFFSEKPSSPSLSDRLDRLRKLQQGTAAATTQEPLHSIETQRIETARLHRLVDGLMAALEQSLSRMADVLPLRTSSRSGGSYPTPSIECAFEADSSRGFHQPIHVQLSIATKTDSSVVELFGRAGKGETASELTWTPLGNLLDDLSGVDTVLDDWMLALIEQILAE